MADIDALLAAQAGTEPAAAPVSTLTPKGNAVGDSIDALLARQAQSDAVAATPTAVSAGQAINSLPRQLGLTARYGMEGLAQAAQVGTEPLRKLVTDPLRHLFGSNAPSQPLGEAASGLADYIGLPSPQNANERTIGEATRMVAGAGGLSGAARLGSAIPGMMGNVMTGLAANPMQQLGSAAGAGLAGGASKEAGGNGWMQAGASLAGGVVGGLVPGGVQSIVNGVKSFVTPKMTPQQMDTQLSVLLQRGGTDYSQLAPNVQASLRNELASTLQSGADVSPDALSRLAAFRSVPGATPTRGMISQNPVDITREQNLAKIAANSADGQLHGLPMLQNQNNTALIGSLNAVGGASEMNPITAGRLVQSRVAGTNAGLQNAETTAWDAARGMPGYTQPISNAPLHAAFKAVDDEGLIGFMPPEVTSRMQAFMTGQQPFTPQEYRNLRSVLSRVASPENSNGNQRYAAGVMGRSLDASDMRPNTNTGGIDFGNLPSTPQMASAMRTADSQPGSAIDAIDAARRATAAKYGYQESSPLVRTALSDARTADPEKIAQSFIINGTVNDARSVAQEVGAQGLGTIRDTLATYIKKQSLSGANDETGKVSQSALNAVLRKIGDEKLGMFFSPEEVMQLRNTGRVASLMQSQPVGSAVNNSNSGALVLGKGADWITSMASKLPAGRALIADPLRNINISLTQRGAQNVVPGLLAPTPEVSRIPSLLLPGLAVGGGLLSP